MSSRRNPRLAGLFEKALALSPSDRQAFIDTACRDDPELRHELASLLEAHEASSGFFEMLAEKVIGPAHVAFGDHLPDELEPGTIISRYEIIERIGEGGMGVVYKARDPHLDRFIALKCLPPRLGDDPTARARLIREAKAVSALDHPNIAVVHEIGESSDRRLFVAMGWYEGETLREKLRHGPLSLDETVAIAGQLLEALSAAHRAGIVHRDVKPSNVVVTGEGVAKLLDFGVAQVTGVDITTDGSTIGTVAYMSPEQTLGGSVDHRSDLWSTGVVLHEMLSGRRPFHRESQQATIFAIRNDAPESPDGIPATLLRIVERCLEKDPADRYQSADELLGELREGRSGTGGSVRRGRHPHRRLAYGIATAAAVATILLSSFIFLPDTGSSRAALNPDRILVAPFENRTGDASLDPVGSMVADWIIQGLAQTGVGQVVPVTMALSASRYLSESDDSPDAAEDIRRLADETSAGTVITGTFYRQANTLLFRATITDANRERLLHALEPIATSIEEPLDGIEEVRHRLMGVLPQLLNPRTRHQTEDRARLPPSYEAYRAHADGMEFFISDDWARAADRFEEAAAHDSTFTVPILYAAIAHSNLGQMSRTDSLLTVLRPRLHMLSELERIGFSMLEAILSGDPVALHRAHERAPVIAPGALAHYGRALGALMANRPREAVQVLEDIDPERGEMRGWFSYWWRLTQAHHRLDQHRQELAVAGRGRALIPHEPGLLFSEIGALAALGQTEDIETLLREHLEPVPVSVNLMRHAGLELIAHGWRADGEALLRRSLERGLAHPSDDPAYRARMAHGHYLLGEWDEAGRLLRQLVAEDPESIFAQGTLGTLAARIGDTAEARRVSRWMAELDRPWMRGANTFWRARIASLLGEPEEAVQLLWRTWREGGASFHVFEQVHIDPDFDPIRDHPAFEEFMRPTD